MRSGVLKRLWRLINRREEMNILEEILAVKRREVAEAKAHVSIADLERRANYGLARRSMKKSLVHGSGIIAEFKRKSPSKGWIHPDAVAEEVTRAYSEGGASGVSILTDEQFFGGSQEYVVRSRAGVKCPILRKDFMVDEYQLQEARSIGADAVLLIAAALTKEETLALARKAHELELETLLEVHSEGELDHLNAFIDMVGVNNRDLTTFRTDVTFSMELIDKLPTELVKVSESGIGSVETVRTLSGMGYQGFLMGENFMKQANPGEALAHFVSKLTK